MPLLRRSTVGLAALITLAAGLCLTVMPAESAPGKAPALDRPVAIAVAEGHLWVAERGNRVLELTAGGRVLRTVSGSKYRFGRPDGIAAAGGRILVLSSAGRVTVLRAGDGSLVRVVHGARYHFGHPVALAIAGGSVWVVNRNGNSVTQFRTTDGSLVRVVRNVRGHPRRFDRPVAVAVAHQRVWVVNSAGSLTELTTAGHLVRRLSAARYGFDSPAGVAVRSGQVWVSETATNAVTELSRTTGTLIRVVTNSSGNSNYGFDAPTAVVAHGPDVYVISPPGPSPMVTRVNGSTADGYWFECNTNRPNPHFANPTGLAVIKSHVWVTNPANSTLVELRVDTGAFVKRIG